MTTPLWELDNGPCPFADKEQWFDSWPALRDNADEYDNDLNVLIWWAWYPPDPTARNGEGDTLTLMMAMPNSERVYPWSAKVSRDEEPEIRAWLQGRLRRLMDWWQIPPAEAGA